MGAGPDCDQSKAKCVSRPAPAARCGPRLAEGPHGRGLRSIWLTSLSLALLASTGCGVDIAEPLLGDPWLAPDAQVPGPPDLEAADDAPLRIVFLGDSVTRDGHYVAAVEDALRARLPHRGVRSHNAGTPGDRMGWWVDARLDVDVIEHDPDLSIVAFGLNDGRVEPFDPVGRDRFHDGLTDVVDRLPGSTLIVSPPWPDPSGPVVSGRALVPAPVRNLELMARCRDIARGVAEATGAAFADVFTPVHAVTMSQRHANGAFTLVPDGIHPNAAGGLVMAGAILDALVGPIADPEIELPCVDDRAEGPATVLTHPFRADVPDGVRAHFARRHTRTRLRVDCLPPGQLDLLVDGAALGRFSSAELADGVELDGLPGAAWTTRTATWRAASEARQYIVARRIRHAMSRARREAAEHEDDPERQEAIFRQAFAETATFREQADELEQLANQLAAPTETWLELAPAP